MTPQWKKTELFSGYITTYSSVAGRSRAALESTLGYGSGSLSCGFAVYRLVEPVDISDFTWKDQTRYSDGWSRDPDCADYAQRVDQLRWDLFKASGYDENLADSKLQEFMQRQLKLLKARQGPGMIVKVLSRGRITSFPDSRFSGIPQWKLNTKKLFSFLYQG